MDSEGVLDAAAVRADVMTANSKKKAGPRLGNTLIFPENPLFWTG
jgi:hypothetical protein